MSEQKPASGKASPQDRGDATREKLLNAAIDVFGRRGFDGASTRALATAAGVNLQAIPYYFGSKQGLYIAAAEHIASRIAAHVGEHRDRARAQLQHGEDGKRVLSPDQVRPLLTQMVETMAMLLTSRESEPWARFLIREQMEPTEAFRRVYSSFMQPTLEVASQLVGILLNEDPKSEHVRLRTLSFVGGIMVFRMAHAAALAHLGWTEIGPEQKETVRNLARELVTTLRPSERRHET